MKKQYICPKSEVINIESDFLLLNTSSDITNKDEKIMSDYGTETDEQW